MPTSPYTRERLAAAAASSQTLSEALTRLGVDPKSPTRAYLRERMRKLGVDTSHFRREGARWTKDVLEPVVSASTTMREVLQRLGLDPVGGQHTHISRRIKAYGIDTSHFAPASHRSTRNPSADLLTLRSPAQGRVNGARLRTELVRRGLAAETCAMCGAGTLWNGKPLRLEVDHISGEWWDNRPPNLRLLCPNCHAVTDSYRGRKRRVKA